MVTTKPDIAYRKTAEWIVTILSLAMIALSVATYYLDQDKSNWVCGPVLLLMEIFAMGLQSLFTFIVWKSINQKIKTLLALISIGILIFIVWCFFNFITKCS